mgnify:CR=1 FL=1
MFNEALTPDGIYLQRLSRFIDVVYALIFFAILSEYLPHFEDFKWMDKPYGLWSHLLDNYMELLRIFIGAGLTLLYWNQNNGLFKHLVRTNATHALLSLVQVFVMILFVYFAIADPNLESKSSPALQAACLAIAGFMSIGLWKYDSKRALIRNVMTQEEIDLVTRNNMMEPLTAVFNVGFAFISPMVLTLAWFLLTTVFLWILKRRR